MAANNCTIELAHGGRVHVAHSPEEIEAWIAAARRIRAPLITVTRMEGWASREARGFPEVKLNYNQIVGIFPLQSFSEPPASSTEYGLQAHISVGEPG